MKLVNPNPLSSILISCYLFLIIFIFANFSLSNAFISRRAKCAIECYLKCAFAGTPKAVYCNCPLKIETDPCDSVTEHLVKEKTIERPVESASLYRDIRTISIRTETLANAFIYIFEYSTISPDKPTWVFAGASSSPQITFTVPDPCRDYQFRTIGVLRSTDPSEQLIVFRPKPIPVKLPPFLVTHESIRLDQPRQSSDGHSLHISVSWHHPVGYQDSDIYGYDAPVAYPIRCQVPEDMLSQPRVEMVEGGAKMHLNLPVDVLQEKCRIYLEVRMIPRCVRIDYFDVQVSIELDCQKFPHLDYCKKEMTPECTDVVDLWGKEDGKAMVVWQTPDPHHQPLYHVLNWGLTQSQGSPPFVTRRIIQGAELKLPGNVTNMEIEPRPNIQYGVQVCAIYSTQFPESPFHIVPVIPFTCSQCSMQKVTANKNCIDCSKIEEQSNDGTTGIRQKSIPSIHKSTAETLRPVTCLGPECASRNHSVHFIASDTVSLDVHMPRRNLPTEFVPPTLDETGEDKRLSPKNSETLVLLGNPTSHSRPIFPVPDTFGRNYVGDETTSTSVDTIEGSVTAISPSTSTIFLAQIDNEVVTESSPKTTQLPTSTATKSNEITETSQHTPFAIDQNSPEDGNKGDEIRTTPSVPGSNIGEYWSKTTEKFMKTPPAIDTTLHGTTTTDESILKTTTSYSFEMSQNSTTTPIDPFTSTNKISALSQESTTNVPSSTEIQNAKRSENEVLAKRQWAESGEDNAIQKVEPQLTEQNNLSGNKEALKKSSEERERESESQINGGKQLSFGIPKSKENNSVEQKDKKMEIENEQIESVRNKGILPDIAVAKVEFKSEEEKEPKEISFDKNSTVKEWNDGRRLHQKTQKNKHKKEPCTQSGGIVCEFGCLDEIRCECPKFEANCIRGILCPFVRDLKAVYDEQTHMLKFFSGEIGKMLSDAKSEYDKIFFEFGELSAANRKSNTKSEEGYAFALSKDREHAMLSTENVDSEALFLSLPFTMSLHKALSINEKMYGLSVCALNSSVVPIIMEHLFAEQEAQDELHKTLKQKSISVFARTLLSPMQMKNEEVNATGGINASSIRRVLEAQKGLLLFIGPVFFLLGLGIGMMCLCLSFARRRKRDRRLQDYSSSTSTLKYGPPNRRFGASALASRTNQLSAAAFPGIGCGSPVGNPTDPRTARGGSGSPAQSGVAMLDTSQTNYYSDNTARFFMQPASNQQTMTISKNVHF